ncbi:MAG: 2-oxoacid:acceptor oxidoreductase subunit alpha, partial [Chloroflexi bacterium]|nr:2-oxoacid:acceptor oxidoreductase subunit alpha [Chloroflexota bacterium]
MPLNDLSVRIGGEAGQGVESSGAGFAQALTRAGLWVLAVPDYHSRIRGGHNFYTIRVGAKPVTAVRDTFEVLLAFTGETVELHADKLVPGGVVIADEGLKFDESVLDGRDVRLLRVPLAKIAEKHGNPLMVNTAALAVVAGLTGLPLDPIHGVIGDNFKRKGPEVVEANRLAAEDAYAYAREHLPDSFAWQLQPGPKSRRLSVNGNEAFAMGALIGGCKFVAGYPMTPATSVMEYLARHAKDWGVVVKHAESEIAAANMVVGAADMGARAMAPTSGGGYDLMTEALSLAGLLEEPIVIYLAQRPGPATGLATRQAQGDLLLAHFSSHGEMPRVIIAPHTPQEHFQAGFRAFNLADKYQCLVVVLSDHYNASSYQTVEASDFDPAQVVIERGKLMNADELDKASDYERYADTPDGISPRAVPGHPNAVYFATSDMHRADGHIDEHADVTEAKLAKIMRKQDGALAEMRPPLRYGPEQADVTFVSWGSSYGPVREAVDILNAQGRSANMVQFVDLWPFPTEAAREALKGAKHIVDVEGNVTGQFAFLLHAHTEIRC